MTRRPHACVAVRRTAPRVTPKNKPRGLKGSRERVGVGVCTPRRACGIVARDGVCPDSSTPWPDKGHKRSS